jgi:hypothetical protein
MVIDSITSRSFDLQKRYSGETASRAVLFAMAHQQRHGKTVCHG